MKGIYGYLLAGLFGLIVLSAAAVWMGGLNQDEGWYLYAAQLVREGKVPFRDFFFTQGPLMPLVYAPLGEAWRAGGILGARLVTLAMGIVGIGFFAAIAALLTKERWGGAAATAVFIMLGSNLYHLYYLAIPKTYALTSMLLGLGFLLLVLKRSALFSCLAGLVLAGAAGTRISMGALLVAVGAVLLVQREWRVLFGFVFGALAGLTLVYGPFVFDSETFAGLVAAQKYHAARGGFDPTWTVGSLSRLVRWYLPVVVMAGIVVLSKVALDGWKDNEFGDDEFDEDGAHDGPHEKSGESFIGTTLIVGFLAVFLVQLAAPFPYEDYQVPVMGLLAAWAAARWFSDAPITKRGVSVRLLLVLGMTWAGSFGSPLLEKWNTNGQDRFWSLKKEKSELAQLRETAREIETLDPGGKDLLTQDLYLAIETRRRVPKGLEMGPFASLKDEEWRMLLEAAPCRMAALSGYSFAIVPPACNERPKEQQKEFRDIVARHYTLVGTKQRFGQNATTLQLYRRTEKEGEKK